jgi:hypothetical protein
MGRIGPKISSDMIGVSRGTSSTSVGAMELHAICLDHVEIHKALITKE